MVLLVVFIAIVVCPLLFIHAVIFEIDELRQFSVLLFLIMVVGLVSSNFNI